MLFFGIDLSGDVNHLPYNTIEYHFCDNNYNFNFLISFSVNEYPIDSLIGRKSHSSLTNVSVFSLVSSSVKINLSDFATTIRFFRSHVSTFVSIFRHCMFVHGMIFSPITNPCSVFLSTIFLFLIRAKRIYQPTKRKRIIAPKKFSNNTEAMISATSTNVKTTYRSFPLSKCSPL